MRRFVTLILSVLIIYSCRGFMESKIVVKTNTDTVLYGETFIAELYVPYHVNYLPRFYIIRETDTARLPIDTIKKCAVFKAIGRSSGDKIFEGYVDYIDIEGKRRNERFVIKYFVKPHQKSIVNTE